MPWGAANGMLSVARADSSMHCAWLQIRLEILRQLAEIDGAFDPVIISSFADGIIAERRVGDGAEHDHRNIFEPIIGSYGVQHGHAVHAGHHHVEDHEPRRVIRHPFQRCFATGDAIGWGSQSSNQFRKHPACIFTVVDNENGEL